MRLSLEENIYRHEFAIKYGKQLIETSKRVFVNDKPLDMTLQIAFVRRLEESLERLLAEPDVFYSGDGYPVVAE